MDGLSISGELTQEGVNVGGKMLFPDKLAGPFSVTYCATIGPR